MEINILEIFLLILCLISIIPIIIFFKRKTNQTDIKQLIEIYNDKMKENLEQLNQGNQTIDELEHKILICKKKLKMNIFKK